ncbi:MAG: RNA polymerase sigma factor [Myxococcota bacterium]
MLNAHAAAVHEPERRPETDEALIRRIAAGDQGAFECLYERYLPRVYGYVRKRLDNRADIEEAVQDVFFAVFSSLESFRGEAPFAAWVLGIARRTTANRFKKKRHPTVPLDVDEPETVDLMIPLLHRAATPLEQYECQERITRIESAAEEELSREQRELFELHHLQHRSISDIASRTAKSEDAVKSNLYRARKVLLAR